MVALADVDTRPGWPPGPPSRTATSAGSGFAHYRRRLRLDPVRDSTPLASFKVRGCTPRLTADSTRRRSSCARSRKEWRNYPVGVRRQDHYHCLAGAAQGHEKNTRWLLKRLVVSRSSEIVAISVDEEDGVSFSTLRLVEVHKLDGVLLDGVKIDERTCPSVCGCRQDLPHRGVVHGAAEKSARQGSEVDRGSLPWPHSSRYAEATPSVRGDRQHIPECGTTWLSQGPLQRGETLPEHAGQTASTCHPNRKVGSRLSARAGGEEGRKLDSHLLPTRGV